MSMQKVTDKTYVKDPSHTYCTHLNVKQKKSAKSDFWFNLNLDGAAYCSKGS